MDNSLSDTLKRVQALDAGVATTRPNEAASIADLLRTAQDPLETSEIRIAAISALSDRLRGENSLSDLFLIWIDDLNVKIAVEAIATAPPFDPRIIIRLRTLLDDPRPEMWQAAASALARKKDHEVYPRMLDWAKQGDAEHRKVGIKAVAFLLRPEEHLEVIEAICEDGPRDETDEQVLIEALRVADSRVAYWRKNAKESVE
jgi:hypothetical protein